MLGSASAVSFMQHTSELKLTLEIASKSTVIKKIHGCLQLLSFGDWTINLHGQ